MYSDYVRNAEILMKTEEQLLLFVKFTGFILHVLFCSKWFHTIKRIFMLCNTNYLRSSLEKYDDKSSRRSYKHEINRRFGDKLPLYMYIFTDLESEFNPVKYYKHLAVFLISIWFFFKDTRNFVKLFICYFRTFLRLSSYLSSTLF